MDARLVDRFGRVATDLRVSLTDRCTMRCVYCMPSDAHGWIPRQRLLTDEEVVRLIGVAVRLLGVRRIRFTGGEPLLRPGLEDIVAATTALRTDGGLAPGTAVTTNGELLAARAPRLARAGLQRVNVSLDTLRRDRFERITRRGRLDDVLDGLRVADSAGLRPVKINTVLLRGTNDDEAVPMLHWALSRGYQLRFIEQMPLMASGGGDRELPLTAAEILSQLERSFTLAPVDPDLRGSAPAMTWRVCGGRYPPGVVGIIPAVSRPFCADCIRCRVTADGQLRSCLLAPGETDLRALLRQGADDEELAAAWRKAMLLKDFGAEGDERWVAARDRPMNAIGG